MPNGKVDHFGDTLVHVAANNLHGSVPVRGVSTDNVRIGHNWVDPGERYRSLFLEAARDMNEIFLDLVLREAERRKIITPEQCEAIGEIEF